MTFLQTRRAQIVLLILLCVLAYGRSLTLPLLEDDYPNITGARTWGTPAGFHTLLHTGLIVLRATGYWLTAAVWSLVGFQPIVFRLTSLALHVLNTLLVFGFCRSLFHYASNLRPAAFWAAAFFAIQEGHQEAVMWVSANNELLMFLFGVASLWCWVVAIERGWRYRMASMLLFALALLSKESAVIFLPLLLLVTPSIKRRRSLAWITPFALLTLAAVAIVISTRVYSFRFTDGSFSLHSPFYLTWPRSFARILWVWGWLALAWMILRKKMLYWPALIWIGVALIPYSFLTYSTAIPSRQTYLASFGLALLVGYALADFAQFANYPKTSLALVVSAMLIHNIGYLWIKKQAQFAERAAPTEQLLSLVRRTKGPVKIQCFPQPPIVADEAVRVALGRNPEETLSYDDLSKLKPVAVFCYQKR